MKKRYLNRGIDAINRAEEISKIIRDKSNDSEKATNWIDNNINMVDFISSMTDEEHIESLNKKRVIIDRDKRENREIIMLKISRYKRRTRMIKRALSTGVAASIVILALFIYNFQSENIDNKVEIKVAELNEVVVDHTKPTLSLSSGAVVNLPLGESNIISENKSLPMQRDNNIKDKNNFIDIINDSIVYKTIVVPRRYTYTVELSDGTVVILNANSTFKYPEKFGDNRRTVELIKGEAYFKVKKDSIPFYVNCSETEVKVYGTEFNINRSESDEVQTLLLSGSVGVKFNNSGDRNMIKPSELITLNERDKTTRVEIVNTEKYIAWIGGYFHFDGTTLNDALEVIGEWYGVKFKCEDKTLNSRLLVGAFQKSDGLEEIILSIGDLQSITIKKEGEVYIVK